MRQRYPRYRDSGVEWLGRVPAHWQIMRIKNACEIIPSNVDKNSNDGEKTVYLCNYTDVYYREHITHDIEFMRATANEREIMKFTLMASDVVFTKDSETADEIAVAAFVPKYLKGVVCGYHLYIARPYTEIVGAFIKRFFDSYFARACFEVRANGLTRVGLSQYGAENVPIALPPPNEQQAIAAFLDRETGKIDALVEEQRRLIVLLKEKRQAVISHAVTKGLDPDAPMKPSGIDWLGDIPEHWTVNKFARCVRIAEGQVDPREEPYSAMMLIAPNHIETGTGRLLARETAADQGAISGKYMFEAGAVIYSKIRPALAKVTVAPKSGLCSADMYPLISRGEFEQDYLALIMLSPGFTAWAMLESDRVAMPKINREKLNELRLPVPPLAEQRDIVEFVKGHTGELDTLISEAETAIDLLQERRSALISAAVTGKIDVRDEGIEEQREQSLEAIQARGGT